MLHKTQCFHEIYILVPYSRNKVLVCQNLILTQLKTIAISVFLSATIATVFSYQIAKDTLNRDRQFRVVDVKQLSEAVMKNVEATIRDTGKELKPEFIELVAKNEAKKLFTAIANAGGENDIIIPKTSVIHAPKHYDMTELIAEQMGLKGVEVKDLKEMLKNTSVQSIE